MNKAEKIVAALKNHLNIKTDKGLAEYFGLGKTMVYSWTKHGNVTNTGKILAKCPYLNIDWLETGEGPMMIIDENNIDKVTSTWQIDKPLQEEKPHKVAATIKPGPDMERRRLGNRRKVEKDDTTKHADTDTDTLSVGDMMSMTAKVLESNTVYRSALASNVRAFYQAVVKENEMQSLSENIEEMRAENREMKEHLAEMRDMLLSLGGQSAEKKRAQEG